MMRNVSITFTETFSKLQNVFGQLDIMVNNAGISDEYNPARMVDINLV